jgi:hypothetical protein
MANLIDLARLSDEIAVAIKDGSAPKGISAGNVLLGTLAIVKHLAQNTRRAHEELEARVRALEVAVPKYCGVHRSGETYARGSIVTFGGSMWYAAQDTDTRPPGEHWVCCVQRGRDGKDAK